MANNKRIRQEVFGRWDLITGQDTYASQTAQSPLTSRKLLSISPSDDGALHRELAQPKYLTTQLSGPVVGLYQFNWNTGVGVIQRFQFAAARTDFLGATTCNFYVNSGGGWTLVTTFSLADTPMCKQLGNLFHLVDGVTNWIFDGSTWVNEGFFIPQSAPAVVVAGTWIPVSIIITGTRLINDPNGNIQYSTTAPSATGTVQPIWKTTPGDTTTDGTAIWTCLGPLTRWQANHAYIASRIAILDSNQNIQTATVGGTTGNDEPVWKPVSGGTVVDGGVTWKNIGNFITGFNLAENHIWTGGTGYSLNDVIIDINGFLQVVTIAGTSNSVSIPAWSHAYGVTTTDGGITWKNFGLASKILLWEPSATYAIHTPVIDKFGNYQVAQTAGTTGTTEPAWTEIYDSTIVDNGITWICKGTKASGSGITGVLGRYYWRTNVDSSPFRAHESDTSPISLPTGALSAQTTMVYQSAGKYSITSGTALITITATGEYPGPSLPTLHTDLIGQDVYLDGTFVGTISFVNAGAFSLTLAATYVGGTIVNARAVIVPARSTHWNLYASEADGSKVGLLLATIPVGVSVYYDTSPFISDTRNLFIPIYRPVRNDSAPASKILEVHKYRLWRRREVKPNVFNFSANEEVASGNNGAPWESVPGTEVNTLSDIVNEVSFPDTSAVIRGIISHGDALYMGSEKQIFPIYGQSIDDFAILQITAFNRGFAGRFAAKSTPHGLAFISYDRKALLYPSQSTPSTNASDLLVDFGRPLQNVLETIDTNKLDQVVTEFYYFGRRNWFVLGFPDVNNVWSTYIYDFSTRAWWQSQRGMSALSVFETSNGTLVLVGGAPDGYVYVMDDLSGTYISSDDLPNAIWRPALIDFGAPQSQHVFQYLELEFSNSDAADVLTVTCWLDPLDVDDPGEGRQITMTPIKIGSNRFRGFLTGGAVCHRLLLEINFAPGSPGAGFDDLGFDEGGFPGVQNFGGTIRGAKLVAKPYSGLTT